MSSRVRAVFVLLGLVTLVATLAFRLGTDVSVAAVSSTLHGTVGPAYEITLVFDDGTPVVELPPGAYRVVVNDRAEDHNFHLVGAGVDESTQVEGTGSTTWNVTFRNNSRYQFMCDPHADIMTGSFDVGAVADQPRPAARPAARAAAARPAGRSRSPRSCGRSPRWWPGSTLRARSSSRSGASG